MAIKKYQVDSTSIEEKLLIKLVETAHKELPNVFGLVDYRIKAYLVTLWKKVQKGSSFMYKMMKAFGNSIWSGSIYPIVNDYKTDKAEIVGRLFASILISLFYGVRSIMCFFHKWLGWLLWTGATLGGGLMLILFALSILMFMYIWSTFDPWMGGGLLIVSGYLGYKKSKNFIGFKYFFRSSAQKVSKEDRTID